MSDNVPPARQCTMPACEREARDATRAGSLCRHHANGLQDDDTADGDDTPAVDPDPDPEGETGGTTTAPAPPTSTAVNGSTAREAFADAVAFFHAQLNRPLPGDSGPDTPREYLETVRGWDSETVDAAELGWAPADDHALLDHLMQQGHRREAILGTGLFWDDGLDPIWTGRYVFPYFDTDGRPAFAISRRADPTHPEDWAGRYDVDDDPAKYHKIPDREPTAVSEPVFGLDTLTEATSHEPVLITEGIADAITAHEAGYACVSPVTTTFKHEDRELVARALADHDGPVFIVQDAEAPSADLAADTDGWDALTLQQAGEGLRGALRTADYLAEQGIDARVADLPRPGLDKVDLDDYLQDWGDLAPVLASAKPAHQHPAYEAVVTGQGASRDSDRGRDGIDGEDASGTHSALYDLSIEDVTGLSDGDRGTNPLGHHGDSKNYFVVDRGADAATDFKYGVTYSPLTFLLAEAGERPDSSPAGSLDDTEHFDAWSHAKREGLLPEDDPVPYRGLLGIAARDGLVDADDLIRRDSDTGHVVDDPEAHDGDTYRALPSGTYNDVLSHVREEYGVGPGRDPVGEPEDAAPGDGQERVRAVHLPADDDLTRTATRTWDWRDAGLGEDDLTVDDARELTTEAIADAYESAEDALVDALPSMGKSYGAVQAAAETDAPVTFLTGRGRKEQYDRIQEWAAECGLDAGDVRDPDSDGDVYLAPAFHRDCETARGDHGEKWQRRVTEWYDRGATPKQIHALAEWALDRPLPCEEDGACRWSHRWDFDPDEFELIVGHYAHGYRPSIVTGRAVVVDEFPEAYETTFRDGLEGAVTYYLQEHTGLPYSDYTDLVEHRDDTPRRGEALAWLAERGLEPDARGAIDDDGAHALAPYAVFTLLAAADGGDLGNGYESVDLPSDAGGGVGVFDHGRDHRDGRAGVHLLRPPEAFGFARCVVGLDGTPTPTMWRLATGRRLDHRTILEGRRPEYVEDALGLRIVRTTENIKPYNNPDHVNVGHDAALLEAIADRHGRKPAVVSTATALRTWERNDVIDRGEPDTLAVDEGPVRAAMYHGNVLGSNEFETEPLGVVAGSNHYGDGFVKRWGAYDGRAIERADDTNGGRGSALSYGPFGDRILRHMREHDTLQAMFRFGRDGNGAVVYVDTDTLPEWVPVAGEANVETWAAGKVDVLTALGEVDTPTTDAIAEHPAVDIGTRTARRHLNDLADRGLVTRGADPEDGRRTVWWPDGAHAVNEHGEVELPPIETENIGWDLPDIPRSRSTYVKCPEDRPGSGDARATSDDGTAEDSEAAANGGPDPPDDHGPVVFTDDVQEVAVRLDDLILAEELLTAQAPSPATDRRQPGTPGGRAATVDEYPSVLTPRVVGTPDDHDDDNNGGDGRGGASPTAAD